jgi:hypothetical protein
MRRTNACLSQRRINLLIAKSRKQQATEIRDKSVFVSEAFGYAGAGGHAKADPFDIILIHNHIKIYVVKNNSFYFLNFLSKQIKTQSCLPDKAAGGTLRLDTALGLKTQTGK